MAPKTIRQSWSSSLEYLQRVRTQLPSGMFTQFHKAYKKASCTRYLAKFLSSQYLDIIILLLVLVDLACVAAESSIDLHVACVNGQEVRMAPAALRDLGLKHADLAEEVSLYQSPPRVAEFQNLTLDAPTIMGFDIDHLSKGNYTGVSQIHMSMLQASAHVVSTRHLNAEDMPSQREEEELGALVCETKNDPTAHKIVHTVHYMSIAILGLFMLEILAKIYVNYKEFFSSNFEILDLVVVSISLLMDTVVEAKFEEVLEILIIARMWRFVRLIHGFIEIMDSETQNLDHLQEEIKAAKDRRDRLLARKAS